jgi:hypothetical protein
VANSKSGWVLVMGREVQGVAGRRDARKAPQPVGPVVVYSIMRNKANSPLFWPENGGRAEKQGQTKPISRLDGLWRVRVVVSKPSGIGVRHTRCRFVQNKANLRCFWAKNEVRASKAKPIRANLLRQGVLCDWRYFSPVGVEGWDLAGIMARPYQDRMLDLLWETF